LPLSWLAEGHLPTSIITTTTDDDDDLRDVKPCSLAETQRRLGVKYFLYLKDRMVSQASNTQSDSIPLLATFPL
jgi:hypothetical protein